MALLDATIFYICISYEHREREARGGNRSRSPRNGASYYVCMTLFIIYFIWPRLTWIMIMEDDKIARSR